MLVNIILVEEVEENPLENFKTLYGTGIT